MTTKCHWYPGKEKGIYVKKLRKSEASMDSRLDNSINDIVGLIIMYQYWFIHCDKCTILT